MDQPLTLSLRAIPGRVYRDPYPLPFATLSFWLGVPAVSDQLVPRRASLDLLSAGGSVGSMLFEAAQLAALSGPPPRFSGLEGGLWLSHRIVTPLAVPVDLVRYQLELAVAGASRRLAVDVPVLDHQQRTRLMFPVAGRFTIVFGHASEGDHTERSQAFAYDIAPLGPRYELLVDGDGSENAHFAGWERDVRAPAAGTVARVQEGLPDNPRPGVLPDLDLMDGPKLLLSDGLPARFVGLESEVPRRGAMDEAP